MIELSGVTKCFDDFIAVNLVSFEVQPGQILALLGPNGAGKTTLVRMVAALLLPSQGGIRVHGFDTVEQAHQVREVVGLVTELPGLYERMNAIDYLQFFGRLRSMPPALLVQRIEELLRTFDLWRQSRVPIATFSKGMRQKMALSRALLHDPPVMLFDEPTSALDPGSARLVRDYILELRRRGRSIILCTHNLNEAEELADVLAILHRGRLVALGSPSELRERLSGPSSFRLRLVGSPATYVAHLDGLVQIQDMDDHSFLFSTEEPATTNPIVIQRLVAAGAKVVAVTEARSNLEAAYLRIVGEASDG
ncbi:MAG: ABC transporter ATP-binding protein [Chloroflexi bacterium]|nr:ABC transporter ATP-binding protein [Chloroflexota bacterium]